MKQQKTINWEVLADELAPESLQNLTGGTGGIGLPNHDLVTPEGAAHSYDDDTDDVEQLKEG